MQDERDPSPGGQLDIRTLMSSLMAHQILSCSASTSIRGRTSWNLFSGSTIPIDIKFLASIISSTDKYCTLFFAPISTFSHVMIKLDNKINTVPNFLPQDGPATHDFDAWTFIISIQPMAALVLCRALQEASASVVRLILHASMLRAGATYVHTWLSRCIELNERRLYVSPQFRRINNCWRLR